MRRVAGWVGLFAVVVLAHGAGIARPAGDDEDGFEPLLDGRDLSGWVAEGETEYERDGETRPAWTIADGVVACDGNCFGFLRYEKKLCDFAWRLEFRLAQGGNSGLGIRAGVYTGADETRPSFAGYEIQLMDDADKEPDTHSSGSLYRYVAPHTSAVKPAGEWNAIEIRCQGPHLRVTINDKVVQDVDQTTVAAIKDKPLCGYISLQTHTRRAEFRNLRLKQL